ncbi:hypothetical protein LPJ55_002930 [Coemansia sp. RSA 990]|nr:hypothetical protein LPJ55_002930 [Coemansia sp. RSA 990]
MPTAEAFLGVLPFNLKGTSSPIPRPRNQTQGTSINDRFSRLFRHRGSRVVTAEVDQQRTRVDRTCISEFETQYLQQRSTELLLQENCAVARLLCHLEVSGDRAATMASHLVSFLRGNPQTAGKVEDVVMEAFSTHAFRYAKQSTSPRNVLRDNNLATMLVVCYLQQTCRPYVISILQPVMAAIEPFVGNCELDPLRLQQSNDVGTTSRNSYNLYCVCRSVLDAVFSAGKHAPFEMRRLCTLLRSKIEDIWDIPMLPSTPSAKPKAPLKKELPILELRDWEKELKSTVQVDIMNDIKQALDAWLEKPDASTAGSSVPLDPGFDPLTPPSRNKGEDEAFSDTKSTMSKLVSGTFAGTDNIDTSLSLDSNEPPRPREEPRLSQIKATWRQTPSPRKNMSPSMSTRFSKHASKRFSGSYFTPVETVISMLIFVRFFIPILTSPEAYGLVDQKISSTNRRGLLLCAKVLAVLCNGQSFGSKEPYLVPMNGLIREYRPKLRQFLQTISSGVSHEDDDADNSDSMSDSDSENDESDSSDSVTIDELASQFQVISVGAHIGTKEEQRKSRMSLASSPYVSIGHMTPDQDLEIPPVPEIPQTLRQRSKPTLPTSTSPATPPTHAAQPLRKTIDLPTAPKLPTRSRKLTGPIAISSSTSDALLDSEIVDESLVTIEFLSCLEGNYGKLESLLNSDNGQMAAGKNSRVVEACRELKPIAQYAKHLVAPGHLPETLISRPSVAQEQRRMQLGQKDKSGNSAQLTEEYEDLGHRHRRTSTLPGNYKF